MKQSFFRSDRKLPEALFFSSLLFSTAEFGFGEGAILPNLAASSAANELSWACWVDELSGLCNKVRHS